jgi:hypothetical protein
VAKAINPRRRQRGSIDELPRGALRVRVYAGTDPISRRRHDLVAVSRCVCVLVGAWRRTSLKLSSVTQR